MALFSQWTFRNILWKCNFVSTDVSRMVSVKEICWFLYIRISSFETYIFYYFFKIYLVWNLISFLFLYFYSIILFNKIKNWEPPKQNKRTFFILFILFFIIYYILYKLHFSISRIYKSINLSIYINFSHF